jgi:hypothetical protein
MVTDMIIPGDKGKPYVLLARLVDFDRVLTRKLE